MNNAKKKTFFSLIAVALIIIAIFLLSGKAQDRTEEDLAACGLSPVDGEMVIIRQGTVGNINGIRIGLNSIHDGRANMQFLGKDSSSTPTLSLGRCEKIDLAGQDFYLISIIDKREIFPGRSGSGNDLVNIFIKKP